MVKNVSIFQNRLVIQLKNRFDVYDLHRHAGRRCQLTKRIRYRHDDDDDDDDDSLYDSHLAVVSHHILTVREKARLQLVDLRGKKVREWTFTSPVTCLSVVENGGPVDGECVLIGLENGHVTKVFVDNPFPVDVLHHSSSFIRKMDVNCNRSRLALVDGNGRVVIYDISSGIPVFSDSGAESLAYNTSHDDLLCYSTCGRRGDGRGTTATVTIVNGDHPVHFQKLNGNGTIVGYRKDKIYYYENNKKAIDICHVNSSTLVRHHVEKNELTRAYRIAAALGVSDNVWHRLTIDALRHSLDATLARKCLAHTQHPQLLSLLDDDSIIRLATRNDNDENGDKNDKDPPHQQRQKRIQTLLSAHIATLRGQHRTALRLYASANVPHLSLQLSIDLRRWDDAILLASSTPGISPDDVVKRRAAWEDEVNGDWQTAAHLYLTCGEERNAVRVVGDAEKGTDDWMAAMTTVVKRLSLDWDGGDDRASLLTTCGEHYLAAGEIDAAVDIFRWMGDHPRLMTLYVDKGRRREADALYRSHGHLLSPKDLLPYASWLLANDDGEEDCFEEAWEIYRRIDGGEESGRILRQLMETAVMEGRFRDVSYYYWLKLQRAETSDGDGKRKGKEFPSTTPLSDIYHAYHYIHSYCHDLVTSHPPETLFHAGIFLIRSLLHPSTNDHSWPEGLSELNLWYTVATMAMRLGALKVARTAYKRLRELNIPEKWVGEVDLSAIKIQAQPNRDARELIPICYRCGSSSPIIDLPPSYNDKHQPNNNTLGGDRCINCNHIFIRCFLTFDILPLVEFTPLPSISDDEAISLIETHTKTNGGENEEEDSFGDAINATLEDQPMGAYVPVTVDRETLKMLPREDVFAVQEDYATYPNTEGDDDGEGVKRRRRRRIKFYRNMIPDVAVAIGRHCRRFFREEDFEFAFLREGQCPISRVKDIGDYGHL